MPLKTIGTGRGLMGGGTYADKVRGTGPIAYWPLWEKVGTVAQCLVNPAQNGTYNAAVQGWPPGPGIGDGNTAPFFDGANDVVNVWSATLAGAFSGLVGSAMFWARVFNVGVWTDATLRTAFSLRCDANNRAFMFKDSVNNQRGWIYNSGGVGGVRVEAPISTTDWWCAAMTWSNGANQAIAYANGVQVGAPIAPIGAWAGLLVNGRTNIGADNAVGPTLVWHGWLAHCAVWNRVLAPAEVVRLATV